MDAMNFDKYYIGYSLDAEIRYKASSGGVGTAIIQYLLSLPDFDTAISFDFSQKDCMFIPKIIHAAEEVNVCGSIYHDIDLIRFVKNNIGNIVGGIVVVCAPCQVSPIRSILNKHKIKNFIISYCCSGQTTIEGTWKYYELLGVKKENVAYMQYRGNGWPSGIQIWLKNGQVLSKPNWTEPWITLHQSCLFTPAKCLMCVRDTGRDADVSLADPWLPNYIDKEKKGCTLFLTCSDFGNKIVHEMREKKVISFVNSSYEEYLIAQKPNVEKEMRLKRYKSLRKAMVRRNKNRFYHGLFTSNLFFLKLHNKLLRFRYKIYDWFYKGNV